MAMGVRRASMLGFRMFIIKEPVIFVICLSRNDPKASNGPVQNRINSCPGILINQSVSRVKVAWPPTSFRSSQKPRKVKINIWVKEKTRVRV